MGQLRQRIRGKTMTPAISSDYAEDFPPGFYRRLYFKFSGTMTASGAGTNAGDGPFGLLRRMEFVLGSKPKIAMSAASLRHLSAFLCAAHPEILPASISNGAAFLGQVEIPLDRLIPEGAIDASKTDFQLRGRLGAVTNLGTTVTGLSASKLRFGGDIEGRADSHFEPNWFERNIDTSAASSENNTTYRCVEDVELVPAIMIRTFDASAEVSDPNNYRSDGMVREITVIVERRGQAKEEIKKLSWGEAKMGSTFLAGISAATGQIQTGVVIIPLEDPRAQHLGEALRIERGDAITIRCDTATTIEDEFTALTPAAGDLAVVSFLNFIPKGPAVEVARARLARG